MYNIVTKNLLQGENMGLSDFENILNEEIEKIIREKAEAGEEIDKDKLDSVIQKLYSIDSVNEQAEPFFQSLKTDTPRRVEEERLIIQEFESRLQHRWLEPFYYLSITIKLVEEVGTDIIDEYIEKNDSLQNGSYKVDESFDLLLKIFGKAVVTGKEIITLLKSGFPDGAMSRWRSLHEYNIYFQNLTKNRDDKNFTENLIKKYKEYSIVERYKEINKYHKKDKNFKIDDEYYDIIEKEYLEVLEINGKGFDKQNAWAQSLFPNKLKKSPIYFSDLEKNVEIDHLAVYYQQANYQIHASPTGIFNSLGDLKEDGQSQYGVVFGPSNYGLSIPGQLTAISLMQLATSLLLLDSNLDRIIRITILQKFVDLVTEKFTEVQLEIEEQEFQMSKNKEKDFV